MIIAIALVCFVVGFLAAIVVASNPTKSRKDVVGLSDWLRVIRSDVSSIINNNCGKQQLPTRVVPVANEEDGGLLSKEQVETSYGIDSWQGLAYQDFKTAIMARESGLKTFPCIYATMGYRADEHRYVFLKSDNPAEPQNIRLIAPALRAYLSMSQSLGPNTSLVIVCAPSEKEKTVEEYNDSFWDMLRGLRISDPQPWPKDVPESVDSEKWTFCYNGEPIFPVMLTPAHMQRWSRHMSVPIIALQPKWVLDRLLSTPEKREAATGKVRKLLKEYDQIDISPDLTSYGQPGTSEARQLCLLDENETASCPYNNFDR